MYLLLTLMKPAGLSGHGCHFSSVFSWRTLVIWVSVSLEPLRSAGEILSYLVSIKEDLFFSRLKKKKVMVKTISEAPRLLQFCFCHLASKRNVFQ